MQPILDSAFLVLTFFSKTFKLIITTNGRVTQLHEVLILFFENFSIEGTDKKVVVWPLFCLPLIEVFQNRIGSLEWGQKGEVSLLVYTDASYFECK